MQNRSLKTWEEKKTKTKAYLSIMKLASFALLSSLRGCENNDSLRERDKEHTDTNAEEISL